MLMMRSDLLFLSDDEVLTSLDAYKKSLKSKVKVKDENSTITILAYSGKLYKDYGQSSMNADLNKVNHD